MSDCKECIRNKVWTQFLPDNFLNKCLVCNQKEVKKKKIFVYGEYFVIIMYLLLFFLAYYVFVS